MFRRHDLRITHARVIHYRMPLKRAYGTARGVTRAGINFLVQVKATYRGRVYEGVGECQPRHALTGDGGKNRVEAWRFACAATDRLYGLKLRFKTRSEAVGAVRDTMAQLDELARVHADEANRDRPFRGTLLGFEVALLDLVAHCLDLQVSELFGKRRDDIGVSISTISSAVDPAELPERVQKQRRFPMTRIKGTGDVRGDLALLLTVNEANRSAGREKPLWIDINEAMSFSEAEEFITLLAAKMHAAELPPSVVIEGILPTAEVIRLPALQTLADHACAGSAHLDLRIMPDEGFWDKSDLEKINAVGGCRAVNIKAPKAGGLIASLELAEAAVATDPDVRVSIGGMIGTSDVTAFALHNLARALPRIDYLTAVPPGNVEARFTEPIARYKERGSNMIVPQEGPGLGIRIQPDVLAPYIEDVYDPAPAEAAVFPAITKQEPAERVLAFGGDTSLGDVYVAKQGGNLKRRLEKEPMSFFAGLTPLVGGSNFTLLNLETVLATSPTSPFEGKKSYLGWDKPERTIACLKELGVHAVGLANNHTMDFGADHLVGTINALDRAGIATVGAGPNRESAAKPLTIPFSVDGKQRRLHIIAGMQVQAKLRDEFDFYAAARKPGVNSLAVSRTVGAIRALREQDPYSFIIVFPHWGRNYQWADERLQRAATAFQEAGANLIIGHGAHMLQECSFTPSGGVVYSIGNFLFNWGGRFAKLGAPPFGLVARLHIKALNDSWEGQLRLYPILADNRQTEHCPAPVTEEDFHRVWSLLSERDIDGSFAKFASRGNDSLGHYIGHTFAADPALTSPGGASDDTTGDRAHAVASLEGSNPEGNLRRGDQPSSSRNVYDDEDSKQIMRQLDRRLLSSLLIAREAEADGARVEWLSSDTFVAATPDGELLFKGNRCTESVPANRLVQDKGLLKKLLTRAGVPAPAGGVATSLDEAVEIFQALARPAVVKPRASDRGVGITTNITTTEELKRAYQSAASRNGVVIEEFASGPEYRCVATNDECLGVLRRDAPHVIGDGRHTIAELIQIRNEERRRNPHLQNRLVAIDRELISFLRRSSRTLSTVPDRDEKVYVFGVANFTRGADSIECGENVPPIVKQVAIDAVRAVPGLGWGGVDVILRDTSKNSDALVLEINVNAGIAGFHYPVHGRPRNIARRIWETRRGQLRPAKVENCPPTSPTSAETIPTVRQDLAVSGSDKDLLDLGTIVKRKLAAADVAIEELTPQLMYLRSSAGSTLAYRCLSTETLATVAQVVNRKTMLQRLLKRANVATPPSKLVRGPGDLRAFINQVDHAVRLLPVRGQVSSSVPTQLNPDHEAASLAEAWDRVAINSRAFAQVALNGTRLRVLTTRSGALAVLGSALDSPSQEALQAAASLAVRAINAVPELNYAAVDVLTPSSGKPGHDSAPLIEAIALDLQINPDDNVILGSVSSFVDHVSDQILETRVTKIAKRGAMSVSVSGASAEPLGFSRYSQAQLISERALRRGITVSRAGRAEVKLQLAEQVHRFRSGWSTLNSELSRQCTRQKEVTSRLLREQGFSALENCVFRSGDVDRAWEWAKPCLPVVLKPNAANKGTLVHVGIDSYPDFALAFERIADKYGQVLVEELAYGEEHRFAVLDGKVIAITNRVSPYVTGDGTSSIADLIEAFNVERATKHLPAHRKPIIIDQAVESTLSSQNMPLESVPADGQRIWLRRTSNISLGGLAVDRTDDVPTQHITLVEQAAQAIPGLRLSGFDVLLPTDGDGVPSILEVNPNPMLSIHALPWTGEPRNVYDLVLDAMFPSTVTQK